MIDLQNLPPAHFVAGIMVITSATVYGFSYLSRETSGARSVWKTLPVVLMAGIAFTFAAPALLIIALLLCALGDYFMSRGGNRFIPGLLAFLVGHIAYIALFFTLSSGFYFRWPMLLIILYSGIFAAYMWNATGKHRWPVLAYIVVITAMAGASLRLPSPYYLTVLGAFIFVVSDSVLAIRMFVVSKPRVKLMLSGAVWIFYIAGQSLILTGVLGAS
jgi:uncharacterized membrane protein YhhN